MNRSEQEPAAGPAAVCSSELRINKKRGVEILNKFRGIKHGNQLMFVHAKDSLYSWRHIYFRKKIGARKGARIKRKINFSNIDSPITSRHDDVCFIYLLLTLIEDDVDVNIGIDINTGLDGIVQFGSHTLVNSTFMFGLMQLLAEIFC